MESHDSFANRITARMSANLSAGLDEDMALDTLAAIQEALKLQAQAMVAQAKQQEVCPLCERPATPVQSRDIAHVAKALDEATRLWQYAKGEPDHRSSVTSDDKSVLRALKDWQVAQVWTWLDENAAEGAQAR